MAPHMGKLHMKRAEVNLKQKNAKKERKDLLERGLLLDPSTVLHKLLRFDQNADLYLVSGSSELACGVFLREGRCADKRCKLVHKVSIAALADESSQKGRRRTRSRGKSMDEADLSITTEEPALELDAGPSRLLWPAPSSMAAPKLDAGALGSLCALPEHLLAAVVGLLEARAMCAAARGCRGLRAAALASKAVDDAKRARLPALRASRLTRLLGAGNPKRLRYATIVKPTNNNKEVLAYDHSNLEVWRDFEALCLQ